ncbi:alpha/beta hydrolase family protein [Limnoglobus roseus]|uniref:Putative alpha/beta-hydrolase-type carbohydrate esterase (Acetyl xylan esterase) n=1 Tax=Limnoglobus roseus TaxID=2598579 RepID=A0A5C1AJW9_9BACT|nr:acetylxylan esterase [Limnoglobus roseus]QEL18493.1 putative alpha/beta-hydrolase-type carbohydrate esterase (acetyl xylan esterase) [Limnoglobus roseus]
MRFVLTLLALVPVSALAADPQPDLSAGRAMIDNYFRVQSKQIADQCLNDLTTKADWEKRRVTLRQQYLEMMGLWPMPARTDLKPVVTGTVEAEKYRVEKLHFQSMPGLYVTANLYLPKGDVKNAPTVLYVCGHGNVVEKGVSYGSKVFYQYHPAWFAAHGYACLILDTLQLHEIPGQHHGTYREKMWWWHTRGYTPAGIELWNAIRAIDYLETRPEVDAKRIGLTGRSGGGATSWWTAAADERIQAVVPVAGFADLTAHISDGSQPGSPDRLKAGVIAGHCDCMFPVNTYRWDFAQIAALIAPRPLLLGNSDADDIFPVAGYRRIAGKVRKVYALYGAEEKFQLLETKGPHKDTPELRVGINKWMNRWLKNDTTAAVEDDLPPKLPPEQLKVLAKTPEDSINTTIQDSFIKPAKIDLPESSAVTKEWWSHKRGQLVADLRDKVFSGWAKQPPALGVKAAGEVVHNGVKLQAFDFVSEEAIPLRLFVMSSPEVTKPTHVMLSVLDEMGWQTWCRDLGPEYAALLQRKEPIERDEKKFAQNAAVMKQEKVAFAAVCPRGIGPTRWAVDGSTDDTQIRRRFPLLGQTLDGQRVWDTRRAVQALAESLKDVPVRLHGERDAAGIALYASLFEPAVAGLDLWHLPTTHRDGPILLNVARVLDVPQAVALTTVPVTLHVKPADREAWAWPVQLQKTTGEPRLRLVEDRP